MERPSENLLNHFIKLSSRISDCDDDLLNFTLDSFKLGTITDEIKEDVPNEDIIGIWKNDGKGVFRADAEKRNEWQYWSNMQTITPKKEKVIRVIYLGESAARGYFYDPIYTPAKELENMFKDNEQEVEVIDLARTDLSHKKLIELIRKVHILNPDEIVIYAGNNWNASDIWRYSYPDNVEIAESLEKMGSVGLENWVVKSIRDQVEYFLQIVRDELLTKGIRVHIVVPDYNITNWEIADDTIPTFVEEKSFCTESEICELMRLVKLEKWREIIDFFGNKNQIEKFFHISPLKILSKAYVSTEEYDKAYNCCRRITDLLFLTPHVYTPRAHSVVRDTLLNANDINILSLEKIFGYEKGNMRDDSKYYLDYCHLTELGIKKLTLEICNSLGLKSEDGIKCNVLTQDSISDAYLLAAIHNAHWGQNEKVIRGLLTSCLMNNPSYEAKLIALVKFQTRKLPYWMSKNSKEFLEDISQQRQRHLTIHKGIRIDRNLINAIYFLLSTTGKSIVEKTINENYLCSENESINLLSSHYFLSSISDREAMYDFKALPSDFRRFAFFRSFSKSSQFVFHSSNIQNQALLLVIRTPFKNDDKIMIKINCTLVATYDVTDHWSKIKIQGFNNFLRKGENTLEIIWPHADVCKIEQAYLTDIYDEMLPQMVEPFGDISTLRIFAEQ